MCLKACTCVAKPKKRIEYIQNGELKYSASKFTNISDFMGFMSWEERREITSMKMVEDES